MPHTRILAAGLAALTLSACGGTAPTNFTGRVYDGASGSRLADYKLFLEFNGASRRANVDRNGRYKVGPVASGHDFTIAIEAEGYRSFLSHNPGLAVAPRCRLNQNNAICPRNTAGSRYFDAYLFPEGLPSPEVTFDITLDDSEEAPSGLIRLRPTTLSVLYDDPNEQRAGIGTQVWSNDDDLQNRAVTKSFSDGVVTFDEGELTYGVTYTVTVFGVDGYVPRETTYQSGLDGNGAVTLSRVADTPLQVVFQSPDLGVPNAEGTIFLVFNQPIAWDYEELEDDYLSIIDGNFSIFSPDDDGDGNRNELPDASASGQPRGTNAEINGNQLILTWDGTLSSSDGDDPIISVTYAGLSQIGVRAERGPLTNRDSVGSILGSDSISVNLIP